MPVPSAITDLSTTAASNSPAGSENVFPELDNYLRAYAAFIAENYANKAPKASPAFTGQASFAAGTTAVPSVTFTGDTNTGLFSGGADVVAISTGGAERARIISDGKLLMGTSTSQVFGFSGQEPLLQVHGATGSRAGFARWTADANPAIIHLLKSRGAAVGSRAIVQSGDSIGAVTFDGDDGTSSISAARISAEVDGTPGTNDMPARLVFSTTADGASSPTERMRIDSAGNVGIGTTAPTEQLDIAGDAIRVRTSQTPASATASGTAGMWCWDANYFYVCTATNTWKRAALSTW